MTEFLPPEDHLPQLRHALLIWFDANQRPLPWRTNYTPYEVWISEVMLQQTQMDRVVEYFIRWKTRFPDIRSLSAAAEDEVMRLWEGLGYYSRARHILSAARIIVEKYNGVFPDTLERIRALPGIGPYTAGAIGSIVFGEKLPCIDANVERVISRIFNIDSPAKLEPAASKIRALALALVPEGKAREHNQAMMELGALVCVKNPRCERCPLTTFCTSRKLGITTQRPVRGKKAPIKPIAVATGLLWHKGKVFVQKRWPDGVWGNLWEFPGGRIEKGESPSDAVIREFSEETGLNVMQICNYGVIKHGYTTYKITLHCFGLKLRDAYPPGDSFPVPLLLTAASAWRWVDMKEIAVLPMPAPHRKLADMAFRKKSAWADNWP